jgi:U3 small nucleolar RNA-associated protein 20
VGNTLYSTNGAVLVPALKCAALLSRCPLKSLHKSLPVFVKQILEIVKLTGSSEAEVVQVALRSLATLMKEGQQVQMKEQDLTFLLEFIMPDIEHHERQNIVFTVLRAIISRKFIVPEIYDAMERVIEVMVTSQSPQARELCRGALLQFLLDYPQGRGRLRNQMTFLAKNLSYVYESGRISVMELLGAILSKFQEQLILEFQDILFVALVMVLANDESSRCREMAAQLIKSLIVKLDENRQKEVVNQLHVWASQESQILLKRVALQVFGIMVDALQHGMTDHVTTVVRDSMVIIEISSQQLLDAEEDTSSMEVELDWQAPYYALLLLSKVFHIFPEWVFRAEIIWDHITVLLLFPQTWVRTASCRLYGVLFAASPLSSAEALPASASNHFTSARLSPIAKKLCLQLRSEYLDEALSLQVVKNLFYIGKYFCQMPETGGSGDSDGLDGEKEEEESEGARTASLSWLFSRLSHQIRSALLSRRNLKTNTVRCLLCHDKGCSDQLCFA